MSGFNAKVAALAVKDLRVEARGRDTLPPMLAFAVTVVLILAFVIPDPELETRTAPSGAVPAVDVLSAFFWITVLFAGLIGFGRSFEVEREDGALDSLLLAPLDRSGHFLAKALGNLTFIVLVELVLVPAVTLLFALRLGMDWATFLLVVALVDIGFVAVGTLLSAVAAQTRSRELVLPILALPMLVPAFLAAFELTADLFSGAGLDAVASRGWFGILIAYDVILSVAAALTFEFVIDA
jgi:heme exporter protein B